MPPRIRTSLPLAVAVLLSSAFVPCAGAQENGKSSTAGSDLRSWLEVYSHDKRALERRYDVPLSPKRRDRMLSFFDSWLERVQAVRIDDLDAEGRVDALLFENLLQHEVAALRYEEARNREVAPLVPFSTGIVALAEARRRMESVEARSAAQTLNRLAEQVEGLLDEERGQDILPTILRRAAMGVGDLRSTLGSWHRFHAGYDPLFTWWANAPYKRLRSALERYEKRLRKEMGGDQAVIGDPIGRQALLDDLAFEMIPYSPDELIAIAEKEFAWCDAQMLAASRKLGFGENWKKALDHVKNLHVEPGKQPDLIRIQAEEAVRFLEERDLVTIPPLCKETWRMEMMSPARQKVSPYFLGGETIIVSFPTDTMEHDDKLMSLRGNNIHFARATVHHELIPGHHLQGFMQARYSTWRRPFRTPFWLEGWALYWEMLLWDLDFPKSPENRVGMLFWRRHRCARIIFSLSFHLKKMTAQEAIEFLIQRVGHERNNATAEVRRSVNGDYGPLYQAAYMLGGLQFRALRRHLVVGGKMTDRQFHDAILKGGSMPVAMVRARLTNQKLTRPLKNDWRFYHGK